MSSLWSLNTAVELLHRYDPGPHGTRRVVCGQIDAAENGECRPGTPDRTYMPNRDISCTNVILQD